MQHIQGHQVVVRFECEDSYFIHNTTDGSFHLLIGLLKKIEAETQAGRISSLKLFVEYEHGIYSSIERLQAFGIEEIHKSQNLTAETFSIFENIKICLQAKDSVLALLYEQGYTEATFDHDVSKIIERILSAEQKEPLCSTSNYQFVSVSQKELFYTHKNL